MLSTPPTVPESHRVFLERANLKGTDKANKLLLQL